MCGIVGKFDFRGAVVSESEIRSMCDTLIDRGPDAEGIHTGPHIGLGERRLSIIDLSEEATPPLANEDLSIWIVFNGEIYNFGELRSQLVEEGHRFRTRTDTEVIVHLYEECGIECLRYLRGMFAFALWDSRRRMLFAARDRLGKKPFFYSKTPTSLVFGSAIRSITSAPDIGTTPNFEAIDCYLTFQYVQSPMTAFCGVFKLPPAHYLTCDTQGKLETGRYWSPPLLRKTTADPEEIQSELLWLLRESVRIRLIADVPLGAFLSGGIDSGTIVALMASESSRTVRTFSIGFDEASFNELPYARQVAEKFGTEHHEFIVKPSAAEVLPILVRHYNEPFADSSAIPTYYVSQMARQHITVALTGDGGDESFGGYTHYRHTQLWAKADFVPWLIRRKVAGIIEASLEKLPYGNVTARMARAWHMLGSQLPERYLTQISLVKPQEKRACYSPYLLSVLGGRNGASSLAALPWDESMDSLDWMSRHDQHYYLPDCLMVKTDVASMANSLEVRCPFLDQRLLEFAATIPSSMKQNGRDTKLILRQAVRELLPEEVLSKPKSGFAVPLAKWLRTELADMLRATLLGDTCARRGLFQQSFLKRMIEEHISGKRDWSNRLWAFLFLELWFREYVD